MESKQELAILEDITEQKWPEVYGVGKVNDYYERVKAHVSKEVPDVTTDKGRKAIASLSGKVSSSKKAVENPGREYLRKIKELPKTIEAELREFVNLMDKLRDDVRQPLTDYEAEQKRIEAEAKAKAEAEALAAQIEADHEIALLLNEKFDRDRAEAARIAEAARVEAERLAEQQRIEREQRIAAEAAEKAKRDAEEAARLEREANERKLLEAKLAQERAEREKLEAEQRAKQAAERAEIEKQQALQRAEEEKQRAIELERKRAQAEADRIAAEDAKRAANKANQKRKNNEALDDLMEIGCSKELATAIVTALAKQTIRNCSINY